MSELFFFHAMCTLSLSLLLQNPRGDAKIRSRNFLGLKISESVDGRRHRLLIREPGQLRLDSGSLPAGWFPLPDAVGMLLGCYPSASRSLPSTSLEQLLGLGRLQSGLSGAIDIVTSTVRVKQLCEVRTPESLQSPRYLGSFARCGCLRERDTSCTMRRVCDFVYICRCGGSMRFMSVEDVGQFLHVFSWTTFPVCRAV